VAVRPHAVSEAPAPVRGFGVMRSPAALLIPAAVIVAVAALVTAAPADLRSTVTLTFIYFIVVLGLYAFSGQSGVLSFGHIGFMAIGAYATALVTIPIDQRQQQLPGLPGVIADVTIPTMPAIVLAAIFTAIVGYVLAIPLMRLSGLPAGIATLAILVIVHNVISHWDDVTRGQVPLAGTPRDTTLWSTVAWAVGLLALVYLFQSSRVGIRLRAAREDAYAAQSIGVNIAAERRLAFALSAGIVAIAGGLYGHLQGTFSPDSFYFDLTFLTVAMLVVGGIGSLAGTVIGTIVVAAIAESFRRLEAGVSLEAFRVTLPAGSQEIVLAVVLLVMLIVRPDGLMGGREFRWPRLINRRLEADVAREK